MKIKKAYLETLFTVFRGTEGELSLQDARIRDAFMKPLGDAVDTMQQERTKIYEAYCKKKEDGTPDTEDGMYKFDKKDTPKADAELKVLGEEEVEVNLNWGVTPSKLIEIIEKSTYKPKYGDVEIIDSVIAELAPTAPKAKKTK
jgi:hypothetical protein